MQFVADHIDLAAGGALHSEEDLCSGPGAGIADRGVLNFLNEYSRIAGLGFSRCAAEVLHLYSAHVFKRQRASPFLPRRFLPIYFHVLHLDVLCILKVHGVNRLIVR